MQSKKTLGQDSLTKELARIWSGLLITAITPRGKNARKAQRKLKTIAGSVIRELLKKLPDETLKNYEAELLLYQRILNHKKQDKNKIYSIHKPFTACIAKGKARKQYEFGTKWAS